MIFEGLDDQMTPRCPAGYGYGQEEGLFMVGMSVVNGKMVVMMVTKDNMTQCRS